MSQSTGAPLLAVQGITKDFPHVRALDQVDFELLTGEAHALVGENGAGKSTLMHVIGGVLAPDSGEIRLNGQNIRPDSPASAARLGIKVVFQELSLVPNLTVAENIFAGRQPVRALGMVDWVRLYQETDTLLALFGSRVSSRALVSSLSVADQQVVEILKALSHEPRVLILDEPTSSLTSVETDLLFHNIRRLKSRGVGIIYISHHLPEVFQIADRVTVLRDGRRVDTLGIRDVTEVDLVRRMVGRDLADVYGRERATPGEAYFSVDGATGQRFRDVSFSLRRGEILGMAGLVGSGRTEVARALFGAERLHRGRLHLDGQELHIRSVPQAIRSGLGYLTESRKQDGLFVNMSIRENCIAPALDAFTNRWGFLRRAQIEEFAEASRQAFHVVTPGAGQLVRNLSGGNQQKVLLSMWMGIHPRVLIVDEPTRGVDVGARSEIYALLRRLAGAGVGIILISSDLPEVLGMSDRVLVMRKGRVAGEFLANEATEENVIACATGVKA